MAVAVCKGRSLWDPSGSPKKPESQLDSGLLASSAMTAGRDLGTWSSGSHQLIVGSDVKESACNARDLGSNPGSERFPGEGNDNLFQYSCLENSMDRAT